MSGPKDCKVIRPQEVEMFASDNATRQWIAAKNFTIGLAVHPPGGGHAPHVHEHAEEMLYVVSGHAVLQFLPDKTEHPVGPGDFVYVPAGVEHAGYVRGWEPWKVLVVYSPPGAEINVMKGESIIPRGEMPDYRFELKGNYKKQE